MKCEYCGTIYGSNNNKTWRKANRFWRADKVHVILVTRS